MIMVKNETKPQFHKGIELAFENCSTHKDENIKMQSYAIMFDKIL